MLAASSIPLDEVGFSPFSLFVFFFLKGVIIITVHLIMTKHKGTDFRAPPLVLTLIQSSQMGAVEYIM